MSATYIMRNGQVKRKIELHTATGAIRDTAGLVLLSHPSTVIAATLPAPTLGDDLIIVNASPSGTAAHQVTPVAGTTIDGSGGAVVLGTPGNVLHLVAQSATAWVRVSAGGGGGGEVTAEAIQTALAGATAVTGLRADGVTNAAGLYVPALPGDTRRAVLIGSEDPAYDQTALEVAAGSEPAIVAGTQDGFVLFLASNTSDPELGFVIAGQRRVPNSSIAPLFVTGFNPAAPAAGAGYRHTHRLGGPYSPSSNDVAYDDTLLSAVSPNSAERRVHLAEAGTMVEAFRLDTADSATQTNAWLLHNGTLKRVEVGAADSGGTGYRLLRVAN